MSTPRWWDRLSGTELRDRLVQRGVDPDVAARLVYDRDRSAAARDAIDRRLGP